MMANRLESALAHRYTVERELGRGGMAAVYLAEDLKHHRHVAIKVLDPELARALGAERFLREVKVTAKLTHPHILTLIDSGEADGFLYYVMPYIEGETLRERMNREGQLPLDDALQITKEVAAALSYAHSHDVVHRDIKPENVLLSAGEAVVADFGIARAITEAGGEHLTETGISVGTPAYMSPEQASGAHKLDGRSDVYSLGCVLYEMLAGEPPYTGPTAPAIVAKKMSEPTPRISVVREMVPLPIEEALTKALAKAPADRFATAEQFVEALEGFANSLSTSVRLPSRRDRFAKVGLLPVTLGILAVGVSFVILWVTGRTSGTAEERPELLASDPSHVAVLYFDDHSQDERLDYLASGLTEALIRELSRVDELQVVSRNGVRPFRDSIITPEAVGRSLNVGSIVQGSVAESAGRVRVEVALVDPIGGMQIAGEVIERSQGELFQLIDELVERVSDFLRVRLGQEVSLASRRNEASSVDAWELLQQAEQLTQEALEHNSDPSSSLLLLARADSLLAVAEDLDDEWSAPPTQRGWIAYRRGRQSGMEKGENDRWTAVGLRFADRALRLDSLNPDAWELRGTLTYWRYLLNIDTTEHAIEAARGDFETAVSLNPNQASALNSLSHLFQRIDEYDQSRLMAIRAYEADPFLENTHMALWRLFQGAMDTGEGEEARRWCNELSRRFPNRQRAFDCQLTLLALDDQVPDVDHAWMLVDQYVEASGEGDRAFSTGRAESKMAWALVRAGLHDSARAVAERARRDSTVDPGRDLALFQATTLTWLGEHERAVLLLREFADANRLCAEELCDGSDEFWFRGLSTPDCEVVLRCQE